MLGQGWQGLFEDWSWLRGQGRFSIAAYSEFMPPPRAGQKPYGSWEIDSPFALEDPWGWRISAHELDRELTPGLAAIGRQVIESLVCLATGHGAHRIGHHHLQNNPFWPRSLAENVGALAQERYLFLSPLALSKTQDDKGHVRWTLFGGSDQGPAHGFWKSFFTAPAVELPTEKALNTIRQILQAAYGETAQRLGDLRAAGFRILPMGDVQELLGWSEGALPSWARNFLLDENESLNGVQYLLTFRPFELLPEPVQRAYLSTKLHLLPFPGSLVFWGSPLYRGLRNELPLASQILLLQAIARHEGKIGIRVPQSGWLHHTKHGAAPHDEGLGPLQGTFRRSHRWQRVLRSDDDTEFAREDHIHTVLFSTHPDDVGLYGKPMARNAQIWSSAFHGVLHGPAANAEAIHRAEGLMEQGGSFGYRFFYPPMQGGRFAILWHKPLIAFRQINSGQAMVIENGLSGFMTASDATNWSDGPIQLWPRLEGRPADNRPPDHTEDIFSNILGVRLDNALDPSAALTFQHTASRTFETDYWTMIASLAEGRYRNKNSGDCIRDSVTQKSLVHPGRDLDLLADHLLAYYRRLADEAGMSDRILVGDTPFSWQTDFEFPWMGGWLDNQQGRKHERNLVVVIPGRNRNQAVVMADHYDTAYMEDIYGYRPEPISDGARLAASGADDNHSASAALMLAAKPFMELSRTGRLDCDIWLVHLTGEEFPSDCLGARHLAQSLVEQTLRLRMQDGAYHDLSHTKVRGLYVLDMIAHNNDRRRDIFQIAPGTSKQALGLAYEAHVATRLWLRGAALWNAKPPRRELGLGARSSNGSTIPEIARHLAPNGEVRLHTNPRSTLFNTDGQIFSDAGIPTVLFMENYDINRHGYHDTEDTMANIDLDYGAAVAAIAIESVARAAVRKDWS